MCLCRRRHMHDHHFIDPSPCFAAVDTLAAHVHCIIMHWERLCSAVWAVAQAMRSLRLAPRQAHREAGADAAAVVLWMNPQPEHKNGVLPSLDADCARGKDFHASLASGPAEST